MTSFEDKAANQRPDPSLGALPALGGTARALAIVEAASPAIESWISETLESHPSRSVSELGFERLAKFYPPALLESAKVVVTQEVPIVPFDALGLSDLAGFMPGSAAGITYKNTYFVREDQQSDESLHFHELVHVVQWEALGPERFVSLYARGLLEHGYRDSPLEAMAYDLQERFDRGCAPFDACAEIQAAISRLLAGA